MRGIQRDYKKLSDPFSDESDNDNDLSQIHYTNAMEEEDDYHSLKDAKASHEWLEWALGN
jgi:hypothetical protein